MKKTPRKLVLHRETIRTLPGMDLTHVVGGFDSGDFQCPVALDTGLVACATGAVGDSGRVNCDTDAVAIAIR